MVGYDIDKAVEGSGPTDCQFVKEGRDGIVLGVRWAWMTGVRTEA